MRKKIVVYSSLFPSLFQPVSGLFVAELVKALAEKMFVSVIKPVNMLKNIRNLLSEPRIQSFNDEIQVRLPLFVNVPKVLKTTDAFLMALSTRKAFQKEVDKDTSLVHAHFAYPDAAAAHILSSCVNLPLVVTVHGSDINILARDLKRKEIIKQTLKHANAVVCVSEDLARKVLQLGVPTYKVHHIPNGVDVDKFRPVDKLKSRKMLGIGHIKKMLLTVGNLIPIKAYDHLIRALPKMNSDISLVMVGQGHDRQMLKDLVKKLGIEGRVLFVGRVGHDDLHLYYSAADFLTISSYSEGWPTVIYEAFACGLPVLANGVGGIPEAISSESLGMVMENNRPGTIAEKVSVAFEKKWDSTELVNTAMKNSWHEIASRYEKIYDKVLNERCG